jgi:predicted nuclease of predicted toxin-antitoxin system
MLILIADENFNNDIVRGMLRRKPDLDIVRVQDVGLSNEDDRVILEWAAQEDRILVTHDVTTITNFAYERVRAGKPMSGVIEVDDDLPVGQAINDILLVVESSERGEWEGQIIYIPLQ